MQRQTAEFSYSVVRSARRSIGIEVAPDGAVIVRAPRLTSARRIEELLREKSGWIARARAKALARTEAAAAAGPLMPEDLKALAMQAKAVIPERVRYYAPLVGVTYGRITIRSQRGRWGSCSSSGNLSFNCLLMLAPPQVIDSVVVHELCHRRHMDHSDAFYSEVLRVFPDYPRWNRWLKENGPVLLARRDTRAAEE